MFVFSFFSVQILRPTCGVGEAFCYRSYSCLSEDTSCMVQTNRFSRRCESGSVYSLTRRECIDPSTGQVVPTYFLSSWSDIAVPVQRPNYQATISFRHYITMHCIY